MDNFDKVVMNAFHVLSLTALLVSSVVTEANTLIVDGKNCTLQDAITAANTDTVWGGCPAGSGADIIELMVNVTLTTVNNEPDDPNGLPSVIGELTLNGHNHTIARSTAKDTPEFRILHVGEGGNLTLNEVYMRHGEAYLNGGGLLNAGGTVTVNKSTLAENEAGDSGGALANQGVLKIYDSTLANNYATMGGGLYGDGQSWPNSQLVMTNSTVSGNYASYGGGFFIDGPSDVALTNVTVTNNTSTRTYGGVFGQNILLTLQGTIIANSYDFCAFACEGNEIDCVLSDASATDLGGTLLSTMPTATPRPSPMAPTPNSPRLP